MMENLYNIVTIIVVGAVSYTIGYSRGICWCTKQIEVHKSKM